MLLVAVGIFALWIVATGRLDKVVEAWNHITGVDQGTMGGAADSTAKPISAPAPPRVPPILSTLNVSRLMMAANN